MVFSGTHHLLQGSLCDQCHDTALPNFSGHGRKGKQPRTVPIHSEVTDFLHPYFPTTISKPVSSPRWEEFTTFNNVGALPSVPPGAAVGRKQQLLVGCFQVSYHPPPWYFFISPNHPSVFSKQFPGLPITQHHEQLLCCRWCPALFVSTKSNTETSCTHHLAGPSIDLEHMKAAHNISRLQVSWLTVSLLAMKFWSKVTIRNLTIKQNRTGWNEIKSLYSK